MDENQCRAQNLERELTVPGRGGGALCVVLINATTNRSIEDSNAQTKQSVMAKKMTAFKRGRIFGFAVNP